jgi:integrase
LSDARNSARTILRDSQLEKHVRAGRLTIPSSTLEEVIANFINLYSKPKNRSWKAQAATLRKFSSLNTTKLTDIHRSDVAKILDQIAAGGHPIAANRAMSAIKKLFAWALDRGLISTHPLVGMKAPSKARSRDRILSYDEIRSFWVATKTLGYPFGPLLQLLLLTGQRRGEVSHMRWDHLDLERAVWTIPAELAKNGRTHEVPLVQAALAIIKLLPRFNNSSFVFTTTGQTPVSGFGRVKRQLDIAIGISDWTIHDLRRTVASGMARLGIAPHIIEKVLNHVSGEISGVAAIYNRHGYSGEKRIALQSWADAVSNYIKTYPLVRS